MPQLSIGVIVGSLRRESFNRKLALALPALAPSHFTFTALEIGDLPLYNQDDDAHQSAATVRLKQQIRAADGLLFCTPEYNRGMPGVLKNALDHASRPYGDSAWAGKPAGIIGVSPGAIGTALAQAQLRCALAYLDVAAMAQPEAYITVRDGTFEADGRLGEASRGFVQKWMDAFVKHIERHAG
jgi:chromate reductase